MNEKQKETSGLERWIRQNRYERELDGLELEDLNDRVSVPKWQFVLLLKKYYEYKYNTWGFVGITLLVLFMWLVLRI